MTQKGDHSCLLSVSLPDRRQSGTGKVKNAGPPDLATGPQAVIGNVMGTDSKNAVGPNSKAALGML